MELGLEGKRAAVAAASRGLGFAVASALVAEGARVAICSRDADRVGAAARALATAAKPASSDAAIPLVVDVSSSEGGERFVAEARAALGGVDILVANGGGPPPGTFESTPLEAYGPALDLALLSVVAMCRAAVPEMRERRWGRVVAITSISVRQPFPTLILSNTARAGVTAFLKTLAREVAADGVTVNSLQPGSHATQRLHEIYGDSLEGAADGIPAGLVGRPEDFGSIAAFLCSEQAAYVTGAAIPVDGGYYTGLM
jgi:3-oxoacyl-[acyl-carrier protein] reductase